MKNNILILALLVATNSFSQIEFEKGYFIDNLGAKTECYIKNIDWNLNPDSFEYKLELDDKPTTNTITYIREFGIAEGHTYRRATVDIDRSEEKLDRINADKNPIFKSETLYLRLLVDGNADLYAYRDHALDRFFYSLNDGIIEQLVYKLYKSDDFKVSKNNLYKSQLWKNLGCDKLKSDAVRNTDYNTSDLVKYFIKYNSVCQNSEASNMMQKPKNRDFLNLSIRPGITSSSLTLTRASRILGTINFENKVNFRLGLELEYVLPFNKNKWSIFIEPTYRSYSDEQKDLVWGTNGITDFVTDVEVKYNSIELPIGVRHYMFLNNTSKVFVDLAYIKDFSMDSGIAFQTPGIEDLELLPKANLAAGIGFNFKNKYSIHFKYHFSRNITGQIFPWTSDYKSISAVFGYNLL